MVDYLLLYFNVYRRVMLRMAIYLVAYQRGFVSQRETFISAVYVPRVKSFFPLSVGN